MHTEGSVGMSMLATLGTCSRRQWFGLSLSGHTHSQFGDRHSPVLAQPRHLTLDLGLQIVGADVLHQPIQLL